VIPIVDLRVRFDIKNVTFGHNTVIIVVKTDENKLVGVIVDNIDSILELDSQIVVAAPDMGVSVDPRYLEGLIRLNKEEMATLLNIDAVLKIEETV
jgi:purine-binding chemotaxis protein CheW